VVIPVSVTPPITLGSPAPGSGLHPGTAGGSRPADSGTRARVPSYTPSPVGGSSPNVATVTLDQALFEQLLDNKIQDILSEIKQQDDRLCKAVQDAVSTQYDTTTQRLQDVAKDAILKGLNDNSGILSSAIQDAARTVMNASNGELQRSVTSTLESREDKYEERIGATVQKQIADNNQTLLQLIAEQQNNENSPVGKARRLIESQVAGLAGAVKKQTDAINDLKNKIGLTQVETKALIADVKAHLDTIKYNTRAYDSLIGTTGSVLQRLDIIVADMGYKYIDDDKDQVSSTSRMVRMSIHLRCQTPDAGDGAPAGDDGGADGKADDESGSPVRLRSFSPHLEVHEVAALDKGKGKATNISGALPACMMA
jgi:hypothetical protein